SPAGLCLRALSKGDQVGGWRRRAYHLDVRWTGDAAIAELKRLIDQVPDLKGQTAGSAEHTRWVTAVRRILSDLFGPDSDFYRSFTALPWQRTGTIVVGGPMDPQASMN